MSDEFRDGLGRKRCIDHHDGRRANNACNRRNVANEIKIELVIERRIDGVRYIDLVADRLTRLWKYQIVVLNRPGAGGLIAAQAAAGVEKDGYTLYVTQASTFTVLPITQEGKMQVDLQKAFVPIGMVGEQPIAVAVNKEIPARNVAELIGLINKTPGGMQFAATNRGGQSHLTGELFRERAKVNITFVHAQGAATSLNDVTAGRIPIMFEGLAGLAPGLQGGGLKLLGIATVRRLPNLPDLPTISETVPGVVSSGWIVLMAPAGTPTVAAPQQRTPINQTVSGYSVTG
jgi:tripartite-type tricarboxylate transporter receptor subunit TctC